MEALIYVCGVLVLVGGLLLGYMGVSGGFANQRQVALWVLYFTLFFVLTGAFLFFLQRLREQQRHPTPSSGPRPYITVTSATLQNSGIGQKPRVVIEYTTSQAAAYHVRITSRITLTNIAAWKPDYADALSAQVDPIIAPNTKVFSTVFASWETTQQRLNELNNGTRWIYAFGIISYADEDGNDLPPYSYCFRYEPQTGAFAFYTPPTGAKDIQDVLTFPKTANVPDTRPRLDVASIALGDVALDAHPRYAVNLRNLSLTKTALKATCISFVAFSYIRMTDDPKLPEMKLPGEPVDFDPKEVRTVTGLATFTLTADYMAAIKKKVGWLYVFGWIDYVDDKGVVYRTKFCAWYDPDAGRIALCDVHNSAT